MSKVIWGGSWHAATHIFFFQNDTENNIYWILPWKDSLLFSTLVNICSYYETLVGWPQNREKLEKRVKGGKWDSPKKKTGKTRILALTWKFKIGFPSFRMNLIFKLFERFLKIVQKRTNKYVGLLINCFFQNTVSAVNNNLRLFSKTPQKKMKLNIVSFLWKFIKTKAPIAVNLRFRDLIQRDVSLVAFYQTENNGLTNLFKYWNISSDPWNKANRLVYCLRPMVV